MKMFSKVPIRKFQIVTAILFVTVTQFAMGSFTGSVNRKSANAYSLKNFNRNFYNNTSFFSLRSGFQFKGIRSTGQKVEINGDINVTSMMRFEKGNTTYIYPYKQKISVPKFVTPSRPSL